MGNYILLGISILLAICGQLLMKKGMLMMGRFPVNEMIIKIIPMFIQPYVFLGLVCFVISSIFWLVVLSRVDLSFAYPMVSIGYIIVAIVAYFLFGENLTLIRWIGILTICLGVYFISRS